MVGMNQRRYRLTSDMGSSLRERGYVRLPQLLLPQEIAQLRTLVDESIVDSNSIFPKGTLMRNDRFVQRVNAWRYDPVAREVALDSWLGEIVATLADIRSLRLCYSQFMVRGGYSTGGAFHTDAAGHSFVHPQSLTLWIALDDATVESGCVWYLPGTHKDQAYERGFGRDSALGSVFEFWPKWREIESEPCPCNAGDAILHNGSIAHAGGSNMTTKDRRVIILTAAPSDSIYIGRPDRFAPQSSELKIGDRIEVADGYPEWFAVPRPTSGVQVGS